MPAVSARPQTLRASNSMLKTRGISDPGGPIGCMIGEHAFGRSCLAEIRENLDAARDGEAGASDAIRACSTD
jgi:hemerythrin-like domain-containing protein